MYLKNSIIFWFPSIGVQGFSVTDWSKRVPAAVVRILLRGLNNVVHSFSWERKDAGIKC